MLNLLALAGGTAEQPENPLHFDWSYISGNIPQALIATAVGLIAVFAILGILILFITLFRIIIEKTSGKQGHSKAETPVAQASDALTPEVVAAITAAVDATLAEENAGQQVEFVIRKIKRTR